MDGRPVRLRLHVVAGVTSVGSVGWPRQTALVLSGSPARQMTGARRSGQVDRSQVSCMGWRVLGAMSAGVVSRSADASLVVLSGAVGTILVCWSVDVKGVPRWWCCLVRWGPFWYVGRWT